MTRRLLLVLALLVFGAPQFIPQTSQQGFGTVQGTVVRQGTAEPIPDVQITLTGRGGTAQDAQALLNAVARGVVSGGMPPDAIQAAQEAVRTGAQALTAVTDSGGKFTIRNVPAGLQNLRAQLEGYFAPAVQGNYPTAVSTQVTVNANQTSDVPLFMLPGGTVSGRILDPIGRPLADAGVQILRYAYQDGVRTLQAFNFKTSDDRGEYRMYRLAPGEYYIAVNPRRPGSRGTPTGPNPQEIQVSTFYPNAVDAAAALPVKVRSGDDLSGVNIQVRTGTSVKVSGRVTSSIPATASVNARGQNRPSAVILMSRDGRGLADLNFTGSTSPNPDDGTFEFQNVSPGKYEILARLPEEPYKGWGTANPPAFATGPWAFGRAAIEVRDVNVDNVSVAVRTGIDLNGRLIVDGKPTRANVRITLLPDDVDYINDVPSANTLAQIYQFLPPIAEDGSFAIPFLPVGRYRFVVSMNGIAATPARGAAGQPAPATLPPLPATAYVADIRQGSLSVWDNGLVVGSERLNPVDIIVSTNAGSLEGNVSGAGDKPAAGNAVVLVPAENRRQNSAMYTIVRSDAQGHFTMSRLAPGRYTLYAWETVPYGAYQNAEFMSKYDGRGTSVVIEAGTRSTINLKSIPDDTLQR